MRDEAGDRPEQRRLAGAVRADDADPLAVRDGGAHAVEDERAPEANADVVQDDHPNLRLVRMTTAKNGAPQKAVTTPIGSSAGDSAVRATTSASTRKPPPTTIDSGTSTR